MRLMWLNEGKSVNGIQVLKPETVNKMIRLQTPVPSFARTKILRSCLAHRERRRGSNHILSYWRC